MAFRWSKKQKEVFDKQSRGQNLLVRASAGSGKTAVLVERIVTLVNDEKRPVDIDRFLVVTFTRAAAAELKERIRKRLADAAAAAPGNAHLKRQLLLVHKAQITTIDGFCTQLLRDYAHLTELPVDFRVAESGEMKLLQEDVLDALLLQLYAGETDVVLSDFHRLVESFVTGKSEYALREAILSVFHAAESHPYPARFLAACKENNRAGSLAELQATAWMQEFAKEKDADEETAEIIAGLSLEENLAVLQKSGAVLDTLIDVVLLYRTQFAAAKRKKKLVDFPDLEHFALSLLRDAHGVRTDLAKDMARRLVTVMVDEYQDSNYLQEEILTAVSQVEDGVDNYFSVGDIKQSIYAFRNAEPALFLEKGEQYAGGQGRCIDLQENYRSRREVTDTVNGIFRQLMRAEVGGVDYDDSAELIAAAAYPEGAGERYKTEVLLVNTEEQADKLELEARAVAERIAEMIANETIYDEALGTERPVRGGDIAILLGTMKDRAEQYEEALIARGLPAFTTQRGAYFDAQEVLTVLDLLEILIDPLLDIPMAAVLVSPMAGLSAEELGILRACTGAPYAAKREALPKLYELARLYVQGADAEELAENALPYEEALALKLRRFLSFYDSLRERIPYTALNELLAQIFEESGYLNFVRALPGGMQRVANLQMLVDKALAYERGSYVGLFNFIRYIRNLEKVEQDFGEAQLGVAGRDAVRICSIHKSKGLQYPIVFVSGLAKQFNFQDVHRRLQIDRAWGLATDFVDPARRTRQVSLKKQALSQKKKREMLGEQLRVYYVACTRAQQKLVLTCVAPEEEKREELMNPVFPLHEEVFPTEYLLGARSPAVWLLPAAERLRKRREQAGEDCPLVIKTVSPERLVVAEVHKETDRAKNLAALRNISQDVVYDAGMQKILRERFDFQYPYAAVADLPMKLTVTVLKAGEARDETDGAVLYPKEEIVPTVPAFMRDAATVEESAAGGAFRGTAQHEFMRFVDLQAFGDLDAAVSVAAVAAEVARLAAEGKLSKEQAALVDVQAMAAFLGSPLGVRLRAADARGELFREQPFVLRVPASRIDTSYPDDETILVQGIMDAFFEEDGKLVLLDYKSDRVGDAEDLREKYHVQLEFYREALVVLRGMDVAETVIWSFYKNKEVVV